MTKDEIMEKVKNYGSIRVEACCIACSAISENTSEEDIVKAYKAAIDEYNTIKKAICAFVG